MSALLPCPFCGGEADYLPDRLVSPGFPPPVFCDGCHASTNDAEFWNTRTPEATLRAERDAALAEVERLRSAAGYQAEAHTLRTSQKLLAELVRSWGYENRPNESNGAMIRRVLEDQRRQIKEDGDAIVAVASALGAPHYGTAEIVAEAAALRTDVGRLREALEGVASWCEAYPAKVSPQESADAALAACKAAGIPVDAMHGTWARHLLTGIGRDARAALKEPAP